MTVPEHNEILEYLGNLIEHAKRSKSRGLLYVAYGALKMAYILKAINYAEYTKLQQKADREGFNNVSIWRKEE